MLRFAVPLALIAATAAPVEVAATPEAVPLVAASDQHAEKDARDAIIAEVKAAITHENFSRLAAMDADFRSSRTRTPAGTWQLRVFHLALRWELGQGLDVEGECTYRMAPFLARWRAAEPNDPAAAITDAALLLDQAWCFRGNGYAADVAEEAWPKFSATVAAAAHILEAQRKRASADPEFYVIKLGVMRVQANDAHEFARVLGEATSREPAYDPIYSAAAFSLLPQWGGSYAQVEALARSAAEKSRVTDGASFYFRVFQKLDECGCDIFAEAADWTTMKQSMRDLYARYPVRNNAEDFAKLACRMGDGEEGRRYIRALHPEAIGEGDFVALFGACDDEGRSAAG